MIVPNSHVRCLTPAMSGGAMATREFGFVGPPAEPVPKVDTSLEDVSRCLTPRHGRRSHV